MRRSIYYFTMSLDGYIADSQGTVDWMSGAPNIDYGYKEFYEEVGTILLGRTTYEHMLHMGDFFPYPDREVIVFSSNDKLKIAAENVQLSNESAEKTLARLQLGNANDGYIWIGGGGNLAGSLFKAGLIDELRVFVQPVILGAGIPALGSVLVSDTLINKSAATRHLELLLNREWPAGIVEMRFEVSKRWRADI